MESDKFEYDAEEGKVYVRLSNNAVVRHEVDETAHVYIDYDEKGEVVGVETYLGGEAAPNRG